VVGHVILLPLDRILPYEGKSVYKIDVADELRRCLLPSPPTGEYSTEARTALEQAKEICCVLQDRGEAAIRTKKRAPEGARFF